MKGSIWLLGAIFSLFCVSCGNDTFDKTKITGYWSVEKALRDKRETRLLADVFFQFGEDGKMLTNLPNTTEAATDFEVTDNKIIQKTTSPIAYNILSISDSTMVLGLEMNNTQFEIQLQKTTQPSIELIPEPTDTL